MDAACWLCREAAMPGQYRDEGVRAGRYSDSPWPLGSRTAALWVTPSTSNLSRVCFPRRRTPQFSHNR